MKNKTKTIKILTSSLLGGSVLAGASIGVASTLTSCNNNSGKNDGNFQDGQILIDGKPNALELAKGYNTTQTFDMETNVDLPEGTKVSYSLTSADSHISINGKQLSISTGLVSGSYSFKVSCSLEHDGYQTKKLNTSFLLNITDNNSFPSDLQLTYSGGTSLGSQGFSDDVSLSYTFDLGVSTSLPSATTVEYAIPDDADSEYEINGEILTINNVRDRHPLYASKYNIPIQVSLSRDGYKDTTYIVNPVFTIVPEAAPTNNTIELTNANTTSFLAKAGTALYYNNSESVGLLANDMIDLYNMAVSKGCDLEQQINFNIPAGATLDAGLLIDNRLRDVNIQRSVPGSGNAVIRPAIATGYENSNVNTVGILVASTTTGTSISDNCITIGSNIILVMDYRSKTTYYGNSFGFVANAVNQNADWDIYCGYEVMSPHGIARAVYVNGTITSANITFVIGQIDVESLGFSANSVVNAAYGLQFVSIQGTSADPSAINIHYDSISDAYKFIRVTGTGESNGIYFGGDISNADVTIDKFINVKVMNTYRGACYGLRFASTIGGTLNAATDINISGIYDVDSVTDGQFNSSNVNGITFANIINSYSTTDYTTINITDDTTVIAKSSAAAPIGIQFANIIAQHSKVTIKGGIKVIGTSGLFNGAMGINFASYVSSDVMIDALIYMYGELTRQNGNVVAATGINIANMRSASEITFKGIMSINVVEPLVKNNTITVRGINVSTAIERNCKLIMEGIINIVNGDTTSTGNNLTVGIDIQALLNDGEVRVQGDGSTHSAIVGLYSISTGVGSSTIGLRIPYGSTFAKIYLDDANFNLNGSSTTGQFLFWSNIYNPATYSDHTYKGDFTVTMLGSTPTVRCYSKQKYAVANFFNATTIYNVIWNSANLPTTTNDVTVTTQGSTNTNITNPVYFSGNNPNHTGSTPSSFWLSSIAINAYTVSNDDSKIYNYWLHAAFVNICYDHGMVSQQATSPWYLWLENTYDANSSTSGWNTTTP